MLTYVVLSVTAYLVLKILGAPRKADATGYVLVSGLIPLPVYIVGRSVDSAVFPIDVCLLAYLIPHGLHVVRRVVPAGALSSSVLALFGLAILATCSGFFNYLFLEPGALNFYAFTVVKFWEYALLAALLIASRPDSAQLRKICAVLVSGILVYEVLHVLHVSGLVPMSGEAYFGPHAADVSEWSVAPFSDRTAWFLTESRAVVSGTASISALFSLLVFEAYRGKLKAMASVTAILSAFSVFATSSRSDIAGLAVSVLVFALYAPPRRWKAYAFAAIVVAGLYAAYLTSLPSGKETTEMTRMTALWNPEVRAAGDYGYRSSDRAAMEKYLPEHTELLLVGAGPGNFHWYQAQGITVNYFGHNSYLQWTGELGIGGLLLLLAWCGSICLYAKRRLTTRPRICQLAARTCLALVIGRMVAAWGAESLFGAEVMGHYSVLLVGVVYLLASIASSADGPFSNGRGATSFRRGRPSIRWQDSTCPD